MKILHCYIKGTFIDLYNDNTYAYMMYVIDLYTCLYIYI